MKDINSRENFSQNKKDSYMKQLILECQNSRVDSGSFNTMIKGGEVYSAEPNKFTQHLVIDVSERPRTICNPSSEYCGLLTLLQTLFWKSLKNAMPGFIQGYNKKQLQKIFTSNVKRDMLSHSIDGSAFESTQHTALRRVAVDPITLLLVDKIFEQLQQNEWFINNVTDI